MIQKSKIIFNAEKISESLNPLYLDLKINEKEFSEFEKNIKSYLDDIKKNENLSEDSLTANYLVPLFQNLGFKKEQVIPQYTDKNQKNSSAIDLVLKKEKVEVIVETKRPDSSDMFSGKNSLAKSLLQSIVYYFRERNNGNYDLKFIIITNFYKFYIFKAIEFEKLFYKNQVIKKLINPYLAKENLLISNQEDLYKELKQVLESEEFFNHISKKDLFDYQLNGLELDLRLFLNNSNKYKNFYKLFSKNFLFAEFRPDANSINKHFFDELLYILGLKQNDKQIVIDTAQKQSFVKMICQKGQDKNVSDIQDFAMSLIIVWLNRILFIKLIEANLKAFNEEFENFFTSKEIKDFQILEHLFFDIFAKDFKDREENSSFKHLPYLNSSLFAKKEEEKILSIESLQDFDMEFYSSTKVRDNANKRKQGEVKFLSYLCEFLQSYDFTKFENEVCDVDTLMNASVLGLVFEKLNGYKEGSFYTPNFITSYMYKESLEKIVLDKFNELNPQWNVRNLDDIKSEIRQEIRDNREKEKDIKDKYKNLLQSIKICDPAVGSGHFLTSALNVMIEIYYKLGFLDTDKALSLKDDEIYISDFAYKRPKNESDLQSERQKIQKALFKLKQEIIENNLFGVDINPNSCEIARLRLWIELLKNSYYLESSFDYVDTNLSYHAMQTLPNIDINIKCGNSLINYFDIKQNLSRYPNIKKRIEIYKQAVDDYKNGLGYKTQIDKQIKNLQDGFKRFCFADKFNKELKNFKKECEKYSKKFGNFGIDLLNIKFYSNLIFEVQPNLDLFDFNENEAKKELKELIKLHDETFNLEKSNPFEWRFEFPEILNENGDFLGFDLIIGNPPYIRSEKIKELKPNLAKTYKIYNSTSDIYTYFYELGYNVLKPNGILSFITSNKYCRANYGKLLREFMLKNTKFLNYIDLNGVKVFKEATVDTSILSFAKINLGIASKTKQKEIIHNDYFTFSYLALNDEILEKTNKNISLIKDFKILNQNSLSKDSFNFSDENTTNLKAKLEKIGTPLKEWDISINYGIKTGLNEAFIIDSTKRDEILNSCGSADEKERTANLIKPILRGRDIKRYSYEWANLWVINFHNGYTDENGNKIPPLDINDYPNLKVHFDKFEPKLSKRADKGVTPYNLRNCAYLREFEKEKIVWSDMAIKPNFDIVKNGIYTNNTCYMLNTSSKFMLGILNSQICEYYLKQLATGLGEKGMRFFKQFVEQFPIPKITKEKEKEFVQIVNKILECKKANNEAKCEILETKLDTMVFDLYKLDENERNTVLSLSLSLLIALLSLIAMESKAKALLKILLAGFENEIKEAFKFEKGLKISQRKICGKILYPCIMASEPCFIYEEFGFYAPAPANIITGDEFIIKYLLGLLNSKMIYFAMRSFYMGGGIEGELKTNNLLKLPIPKITKENQSLADEIVSLVDEILKAKEQDKNTKEFENKIDECVYRLYKLSDEEIKIIEKG